MITGFTSRFKLLRNSMKVEPCTRQSVNYGSEVLETKSHLYTYVLTEAVSSSGGSTSVINLIDAPSGVLRGDIVRITSGLYAGLTFHILSVSGFNVTLMSDLPAALSNGDTLNIERWIPPLLASVAGAQFFRFPIDMNPLESWIDDFSSTRWGITAMALNPDNVSVFPLRADSAGSLLVANSESTSVAAVCGARGRIAGPSVTNTYATLLSMSGSAKHLAIWNSTDQELLITYDNGTTDNLALDAGEFYAIDFMALGTRLAPSTIKVKWVTAVPKVGSVRAVIVR